METIIWSKSNCPHCVNAKQLLENRGINYEERVIGEGWSREDLLEKVPGARSVPQIFLMGEYIGGYTELKQKLIG